jgi:hypothetical protein
LVSSQFDSGSRIERCSPQFHSVSNWQRDAAGSGAGPSATSLGGFPISKTAKPKESEVREVLEKFVEKGIAWKRTVNGVTRYGLIPQDELAPEALMYLAEVSLAMPGMMIAPRFLN